MTAVTGMTGRWRQCALGGVAALALGSGEVLAAPASADAGNDICTSTYGNSIAGSPDDLDGDRCADLVVGTPHRNAVVVDYDMGLRTAPTTTRVTEAQFGVPSAAGDHFGAAITYPQLDPSSGHADLAVGAWGADAGRGRVIVARGGPGGPEVTDAVVLRGRTAGEHFGASLVADGNDIWVGAPDRTVASRARAGAVDHYRVAADGVATFVESIRQGHAGVAGSPEAGDRFGEVLSATADGLLIGVPHEDVGAAKDAGIVTEVAMSTTTHRVTASRTATQNTPGISGTAQAGDRFGAAVSSSIDPGTGGVLAAVGVPGESIGKATGAGMVQLLRMPTTGRPTQYGAATQATRTVSGSPERGDHFGASVQLGAFTSYAPEQSSFPGDLVHEIAVGSPGEDLNGVADAGTVTVLEVRPSLPQLAPLIRRGGSGPQNLHGAPASGDRVGAGLAALGYPYVLTDEAHGIAARGGGALLGVDAPGQNVHVSGRPSIQDAGVIGIANAAGAQVVDHSHGGPFAGERFGVLPTTVSNGPFYVQDL